LSLEIALKVSETETNFTLSIFHVQFTYVDVIYIVYPRYHGYSNLQAFLTVFIPDRPAY